MQQQQQQSNNNNNKHSSQHAKSSSSRGCKGGGGGCEEAPQIDAEPKIKQLQAAQAKELLRFNKMIACSKIGRGIKERFPFN